MRSATRTTNQQQAAAAVVRKKSTSKRRKRGKGVLPNDRSAVVPAAGTLYAQTMRRFPVDSRQPFPVVVFGKGIALQATAAKSRRWKTEHHSAIAVQSECKNSAITVQVFAPTQQPMKTVRNGTIFVQNGTTPSYELPMPLPYMPLPTQSPPSDTPAHWTVAIPGETETPQCKRVQLQCKNSAIKVHILAPTHSLMKTVRNGTIFVQNGTTPGYEPPMPLTGWTLGGSGQPIGQR
jgi:hypothetical protein